MSINYTKLTKKFKKELQHAVPEQWVWPLVKGLLEHVKEAEATSTKTGDEE